MNLDMTRIRAIVGKELRDYRRNRFIAVTMTVMPLIFSVLPVVEIFTVSSSAPPERLDKLIGLSSLYLLLIPALVPAAVTAYAVVGERDQGTLEPVLSTPVRREELLVGKAAATLVPTLLIAYLMYGIYLLVIGLFAHQNIVDDVFKASRILPQLLFTPLLAGWSIWAGLGISTRANDVRVAQQLSILVSAPPLAVTALMSFGVIQPTLALALGLGAALLVLDVVAWRFVSALFDRERLITGSRA